MVQEQCIGYFQTIFSNRDEGASEQNVKQRKTHRRSGMEWEP